MSWAELIPGLKVNVKGTSDGSGRLVAKTITFSKNDLQTAKVLPDPPRRRSEFNITADS